MEVHQEILGDAPGRHAKYPVMHDSRTRAEITATAARLVAEDGLAYSPAKRRAARMLGHGQRVALPDNDELDEALRIYIEEFLSDTQPAELLALRALALQWMRRMESFRPYLSAAVWQGTATRHCDIQIDLFCDDPKSAEIALIDHHAEYEQRSSTGRDGQMVDTLSVHAYCAGLEEMVGVHLKIHDLDDLRGALRPDGRGRIARGDISSVQRLLEGGTP